MERVKLLVSKEASVRDINGRFIFAAPMTERAKELLDNDGWKKGLESWLAYRNRTKQERVAEDIERQQLANDIVSAYNAQYGLD